VVSVEDDGGGTDHGHGGVPARLGLNYENQKASEQLGDKRKRKHEMAETEVCHRASHGEGLTTVLCLTPGKTMTSRRFR
jgi:hypothetical protein